MQQYNLMHYTIEAYSNKTFYFLIFFFLFLHRLKKNRPIPIKHDYSLASEFTLGMYLSHCWTLLDSKHPYSMFYISKLILLSEDLAWLFLSQDHMLNEIVGYKSSLR